jgi:surface polysaccharide O-acyltransferase-like enzyme
MPKDKSRISTCDEPTRHVKDFSIGLSWLVGIYGWLVHRIELEEIAHDVSQPPTFIHVWFVYIRLLMIGMDDE